MDRRSLVFALFGLLCLVLYPVADAYDGAHGWRVGDKGWAWVAVALGVVYLLLALLSALDARTRSRLRPRPLGYERTELSSGPDEEGPAG